MMKKCFKYMFLFIVFIFLAVIPPTDIKAEENDDYKSVLFISSYSYAWDAVQIQIEGIKQGIGTGIVLDYEFMDTKRVDTPENRQMFYEGLKYRLSVVDTYDAVILGDDAALNFALEYRDELFDGIPLIFEGINDEELAIEVSKDPLITGVIEKLSFEKNIDFALNIYPDAKRVVGIFDDTITGEAERKQFYKNAVLYPQLEFTEINTSVLSSAQLKDAIASVDTDSILIYVVMTEDADGVKYTNSQSINLIYNYANVPAFRMVSGGMGEGILGGNIVSMELSGKIAAEIATEIVNGRNPAEFDVVIDSPNIYCVDESVMRKFGIDLSLIPEGAEIFNHEENFYERNREALVPGIIILFLLVIIIILVFMDNIKKKKIAAVLKTEAISLENDTIHDYLTGLFNRRKLNMDLSKLIESAMPNALVMMDIDDFKSINDTYGHATGDLALKEVSKRLIDLSSEIFTPYRLAGDEFTIVIKSGDASVIDDYVGKIAGIFSSSFMLDDIKLDVKGSVGVALFPKDADNMLDLVACSDKAMYNVKKTCKNTYKYYDRDSGM